MAQAINKKYQISCDEQIVDLTSDSLFQEKTSAIEHLKIHTDFPNMFELTNMHQKLSVSDMWEKMCIPKYSTGQYSKYCRLNFKEDEIKRKNDTKELIVKSFLHKLVRHKCASY